MNNKFDNQSDPNPIDDIDFESDNWFKILATDLPKQPTMWEEPIFGSASIASESELGNLTSPPFYDELPSELPAEFQDVSLIAKETCLFKKSIYLPNGLMNQNLLISSITGGGKSQKFMQPLAIDALKNRLPGIVIDPKLELYDLFQQFGVKRGQVCVFNPSNPKRTTHAINVLDICDDHTGKWLDASQTLAKADFNEGAKNDSHWFENNAARLIVSVGKTIKSKHGKVSLADILHVLELNLNDLAKYLAGSDAPFVESMMSYIHSGSHNAETVLATARNCLRILIDTNLAATTSKTEISLEDIIRRNKILIIEIEPENVDYLRPLINLLITVFFQQLTSLARNYPGNRFPRRVNILLDDFAASVGRIVKLAGYANFLRSTNVAIIAAVQTLGQITDLYGPQAPAVLAGFSSKIFQSPTDLADAEYASKLSGTATIEQKEYSETFKSDEELVVPQRSVIRRPVARPLFLPDDIRLASDHINYGRAATCFLAGMRPFQAWFRPNYAIPQNAIIYANMKKRDVGSIRRKPLKWTPPLIQVGSTPHENRPTSMTVQQTRQRLDYLKGLIGYRRARKEVKEWWKLFENENSHRNQLVISLAEEILERKATVTEFYDAYQEAETDNIKAVLHLMDYLRTAKITKRKKRRSNGQK